VPLSANENIFQAAPTHKCHTDVRATRKAGKAAAGKWQIEEDGSGRGG